MLFHVIEDDDLPVLLRQLRNDVRQIRQISTRFLKAASTSVLRKWPQAGRADCGPTAKVLEGSAEKYIGH